MIMNMVGSGSGGGGGGKPYILIFAELPEYIAGKYITVTLGGVDIFAEIIPDGVTSVQVDIEKTGYYTINVYDEPAETSDSDIDETYTIHVTSLTANYSVRIGKDRPIIKHIQRGTASASTSSATTSIYLTGFTNLNKMVVLLNGMSLNHYQREGTGTYTPTPYYVSSLTTSTLTVGHIGKAGNYNTNTYSTIGYQVIEFY